jgi:hypothetical protein
MKHVTLAITKKQYEMGEECSTHGEGREREEK